MKSLLIISMLLLGAACSRNTEPVRERVVIKEVVRVQQAAPVRADSYYYDSSNFGRDVAYYDMPYVDGYGVQRTRKVYRPNGLTTADLALGIMAGNILSASARSSGRRPIIINQTIVKKYGTRQKTRRAQKLKTSTASPIKGYKKPTPKPTAKAPVKKQGLTLGSKKPTSKPSSFSLSSKKKKRPSFKLAKKRKSSKRRKRRR